MQSYRSVLNQAITLIVILLIAAPFDLSTVQAEDAIYKYTDSSGAVHYVDDPAKIPEEYSSPDLQPHALPEIQREGSLLLNGQPAAGRPNGTIRHLNRGKSTEQKKDPHSTWRGSNTNGTMPALASHLLLGTVVALGIYSIIIIASYWVLLRRAGLPGWGILVPIYNLVLLSRLAGKSGWWTLLLVIPVIGAMFWSASTSFMTAKRFGRSDFFALGNIFFPPIFTPIMAFFPVR